MSAMDVPADQPVAKVGSRTRAVPKTAWISWLALAMMTTSSVASLRAAPTMAVYGLACVFLYLVPAIVFLLPTSLVSAELASGWEGGVYNWVALGISKPMGFLAVWCQFAMTIFYYPTLLGFVASTLAYVFNPALASSGVWTAAVIIVVGASDEGTAIRRMPWSAILMVCGMTMLVTLVEKSGGMDVFTAMLARLARPATLNGIIALVTGVISTYSSTSAVVLPTFLPTVPGLVQQVGGGHPLAVALSINVGASLVDVSPLSTLGALCVATIAEPDASRDLFRKLLIWGLSMSVVGAVLCELFATAFAAL